MTSKILYKSANRLGLSSNIPLVNTSDDDKALLRDEIT